MGRPKIKQRPIYVQTRSDTASLLLKGLEEQREELGVVAEDLITALRKAGIQPPASGPTATKH